MNKSDKYSMIITAVMSFLAAVLLGIVFFSPGYDQKSQIDFVKAAYPGCPAAQTHAGVYIVRNPNNSIIQVRIGGIFHLYVKEVNELIPSNTIF